MTDDMLQGSHYKAAPQRTQQFVHYLLNMSPSEGVSGMAEVRDDEGLTPQGSAWIPGLVLIQGVLDGGGRRIWPHEKPGEYMECTRKTSIHNQP